MSDQISQITDYTPRNTDHLSHITDRHVEGRLLQSDGKSQKGGQEAKEESYITKFIEKSSLTDLVISSEVLNNPYLYSS